MQLRVIRRIYKEESYQINILFYKFVYIVMIFLFLVNRLMTQILLLLASLLGCLWKEMESNGR